MRNGYPAHLHAQIPQAFPCSKPVACSALVLHPGRRVVFHEALGHLGYQTAEGRLTLQTPRCESLHNAATHNAWRGLDWTELDALVSLRVRICLPTRARNQHPFFFLPPSPPPYTLSAALAFSHVLVGPRTLTTWESCMQVRASSHTSVCHKQGSPVHDLHHAHRVQSIPCKMMPSASFAEPSSAWHITSLPTQRIGPGLYRTTTELAGTAKGSPVETVISRITVPTHGNNCPSQPLIPSP